MDIKGIFCISLDFEKFWGVHDVLTLENAQHFSEISEVIDGILKLFQRYDIHATWATVGLLGHESIEELKSANLKKTIPYTEKKYSPFPLSSEKYGAFDSKLLLGKAEILKICSLPTQELASHTYSHFYAVEDGISKADFEADCKAMSLIGERYSTLFKSIVFPRNQVNPAFMAICAAHGLTTYRGNQENRFWTNSRYTNESFFKKAGRVLDAYLPISRTKNYVAENLPIEDGLLNIPASRFLRPSTGKRWLEKRKIRRIKGEMLRAAKSETVYHLWWHPHNFTTQLKDSLGQLEELLAYSKVLQNDHGFISLSMCEIDAYVRK